MGSGAHRAAGAAIIVAALLAAAADPAPPADPKEPAIGPGGPAREVAATVVNARGDERTGRLVLEGESLALPAASGDGTNVTIPVERIRTIEFVRWQGRKRRGGEYAFYPSLVRITMTDGSSHESDRAVPALLRLRFRDSKGAAVLFSSFYDYREKDLWKNSGERDPRFPETHPHPETIVRIVINRGGGLDLLERLFR